MKCEICRAFEAEVHVDRVGAGFARLGHFCEACAAVESSIFALGLATSLRDGLVKANEAERADGLAYLRQLAQRVGGEAPQPLRRLFRQYGVP
jgi:hypothetical protein